MKIFLLSKTKSIMSMSDAQLIDSIDRGVLTQGDEFQMIFAKPDKTTLNAISEDNGCDVFCREIEVVAGIPDINPATIVPTSAAIH